jgi:acylphosphatase
MKDTLARRYFIRGDVQGVGYRYFAERAANEIGVTGYVRNLSDGRVEVYAAGSEEQLARLAGRLRQGPRFADVRGVDEQEAALERHSSFHIKH